MIPILWRYPYNNVYNSELLFNVIISRLSDDSIKLLIDEDIIEANFQKQKLSYNYVRFSNTLIILIRYFQEIYRN
jgi:hypothetical protein